MSNVQPSRGRLVSEVLAFSVSLAICFAAAGIGTLAVNQTLQSWYTELRKPAWNPPNWVFGPVWSVLYTTMAVTAWLVWRSRKANIVWARTALAWFGIQLALNVLWSFLFFAFRQPGWALAEMIALWLAIVMTIAVTWRVSRTASVLLVPYLLWVSFAAFLNAAIWRLNS